MGNFVFPATKQHPAPIPASVPTEYSSNVLRILTEEIKRRPGANVLDVGPVCGENISFIANRVKKLFVCDMYFHFAPQNDKRRSPDDPWQHLNYPENSFDLILIWDLTERLEDGDAKKLSDCCHELMKPGGLAALCVLPKDTTPDEVYAFVIGTHYSINLRPQHHLALPMHYRPNRDIIGLMHPLELVRSFIYRNGVREFLFKRN